MNDSADNSDNFSEQDYSDATASDGFGFVKHNPTDFESFKKFQENMNSRYSKFEAEKAKREIILNIAKWEEMLPPRWSTAILTKITQPADKAAKRIIEILENNPESSLYIHGNSGAGKTYLAYATLRRFIGKNWVSPGQIKIISEEALMGLAASGFQGQDRFNELLKSKYKVYFFDGVANRPSYSQKEQQLWEQLIDHIYSKSLNVIFTSNKDLTVFSAHLSDSADSKLHHLLNGKNVYVESRSAEELKTFNNDSDLAKEKNQYDLFGNE